MMFADVAVGIPVVEEVTKYFANDNGYHSVYGKPQIRRALNTKIVDANIRCQIEQTQVTPGESISSGLDWRQQEQSQSGV